MIKKEEMQRATQQKLLDDAVISRQRARDFIQVKIYPFQLLVRSTLFVVRRQLMSEKKRIKKKRKK